MRGQRALQQGCSCSLTASVDGKKNLRHHAGARPPKSRLGISHQQPKCASLVARHESNACQDDDAVVGICARGTEMSARRALPIQQSVQAGSMLMFYPDRPTHLAFSPTSVQIVRATHPLGTALLVKAPSLTRSVEMISCAELVWPSEPTKPANPSMHACPSLAQRRVVQCLPLPAKDDRIFFGVKNFGRTSVRRADSCARTVLRASQGV